MKRSSGTTSTTTCILVFLGVAAVATLLAIERKAKKQESKAIHHKTGRVLTAEEQYVSHSIRVNMPPAGFLLKK
jgi:hypothetical protein